MNSVSQWARAEPREGSSDLLWVTYRWMTLGLATTGVVALAIASSPAALDFLASWRFDTIS